MLGIQTLFVTGTLPILQ